MRGITLTRAELKLLDKIMEWYLEQQSFNPDPADPHLVDTQKLQLKIWSKI